MEIDSRLSAGDTVPDCVLDCPEGAFDWVLDMGGFVVGGRIECFLFGNPTAGRDNPAIDRARNDLRSMSMSLAK